MMVVMYSPMLLGAGSPEAGSKDYREHESSGRDNGEAARRRGTCRRNR